MGFEMRGAWPACSNLAVNFQKTTSASKGICLISSAIHLSGPADPFMAAATLIKLVSLVLQIKARVEDILAEIPFPEQSSATNVFCLRPHCDPMIFDGLQDFGPVVTGASCLN